MSFSGGVPAPNTPPPSPIKGRPVYAFPNNTVNANATSTEYVDCQGYNALSVVVQVNATGISFTVEVQGGDNASAANMVTIDEANGTRTGIVASVNYNLPIGNAFARVKVTDFTGTALTGQGYQIILTPYVSGGLTNIQATITSPVAVDVEEWGGAATTLGQKVMAESVPVVIASDQSPVDVDISSDVNVTQGTSPWVVSGTVTATQATGTNLHVVLDTTSTTAVTQATGTNLHTVVDSGTITTVSAVTAITNALPAGTATIGGTTDAGTAFTTTLTYTSSADISTAAAISPSPTSGQKIVVTDVLISTDTALFINVQEETTATIWFGCYLPANSAIQVTFRGKFKQATADKKLFGKASGAGNVKFTAITYSET